MLIEGLTTNLRIINQLCDEGLNVNFTKDRYVFTNNNKALIMTRIHFFGDCYL